MSSRPSSKLFTTFNLKSASSSDNEAAVREFQAAFKKSVDSSHETSAFAAVIDTFTHLNSINDRKMALEHVVAFLSHHANGPFKDKVAELQNILVKLLYDDLSHPPATYIGPDFAYRRIDGACNNPGDPDLGKAGRPYARSVQQLHPLPRNMLPSADLVFEALLKRRKFVRHPAGLSSMMFSFAALVIHTVFRTSNDLDKEHINETSSYVDLAPLYGNDEATLNDIRLFNGRGLLKPDCFAEGRLLLLPPAVCVLLVLFNRNHNYIATKLLEINEHGDLKNPDSIALNKSDRPEIIRKQDEKIFQIARLINCSWFGSIIFSDYFSSILGLVRGGSTWSLNPFGEIRDLDHKLFERGRGNACSVEFNCLYRWHATTSQADEAWVTRHMTEYFKGENLQELKPKDFKTHIEKILPKEDTLSQWKVGDLERGPDGRFKDSDLARVIKDATAHEAATFGARGTPPVMKVIECMGIEANRNWGVCSLNDFRKFLGLRQYKSFLEWNDDPEIAEAAERLYTHIDNLELYVGLQAEQTKPVVDGAGLCPGMFNSRYLWAETNSFLVGYTISRAILSDAIALTRGDRFFTSDYTPYNLTAWGFADSKRDSDGPGNGSMLGRLLLRGLPGEFTENSTYAWYPLQTPESMKVFLSRLGTADRYNFDRPGTAPVVVCAREYNDVQQILGSKQFVHPYGERAARVVSGEGFFLASNNEANSQRDQRETRKLIVAKSFKLSDTNTRYVDIVRDVLRYVPLYWAATELAGLTLKVDKDSPGDYAESQLYGMITDIYSFLLLDVDPSQAMNLEARVKDHIKDLQHRIRTNVLLGVGKFAISGFVESIQSLFSGKPKKEKFSLAESLHLNGASIEQTTNNVLSLLVGASVELSQSIINIVNVYLDQPDVRRQLKAADAKNPALEGYIYEAMRTALTTLLHRLITDISLVGIDPPFRGVYRKSLADQRIGSLSVSKGQRVFLDFAQASLDPHVFLNPTKVEPNRGPKNRYLTGDGVTRSLGVELTTKIMSQVLRAVFEFDDMSREPHDSGKLKRYKVAVENTLRYEYLDEKYLPTAWPNTMLLQYKVAPTQASSSRG
ncbi:putative linoleate diol synthase [Lactifluus volemus]|nr:putative linoleate diol synthase [Lactifluus volemus]